MDWAQEGRTVRELRKMEMELVSAAATTLKSV